MALIEAVGAREILDSRGNPTVEVEVLLEDGVVSRAAVLLRCIHRCLRGVRAARRRQGPLRRQGRAQGRRGGSRRARPRGRGLDAADQRLIDAEMIDLDGTDNKKKLGANAILGVSLAVAKAAARRPTCCSATSVARTPTPCRCP